MLTKAVLIAVLLCCIAQVERIPCAYAVEEEEEEPATFEDYLIIDADIDLSEELATLLEEMNYTAEQNMVKCVNDVNVIASLVPDGFKTLRATWNLTDPCGMMVQYRVLFGEHLQRSLVDMTTTESTMTFNDLKECSLYTLEVFALDSNSQIVGRNGYVKTFTVVQFPEVVNLTYNATFFEITVEWLQKSPSCFPDLMYHITTSAGTNKIVSQTKYALSGLPCNTSYDVTVSPVDANSADYGVAAVAKVKTKEELIDAGLSLTTPEAQAIVVTWKPFVSVCMNMNITGYQVNLTEAGAASVVIRTTNKTYFHFSVLKPSTTYAVHVRAMNGSQPYPISVSSTNTTLAGTYTRRCPFPDREMYYLASAKKVWCATVVHVTTVLIKDLYGVCTNHSYVNKTSPNPMPYRYIAQFPPHASTADHLRTRGYTEDIRVSAFYEGAWVWGVMGTASTYVPIAADLLTGVPPGGSGPTDYRWLYMDPKKDFALSATKDGYAYGAILCIVVKLE